MSGQNITLYLHIGLGKTGTSSIQNFLAGNIRVLWESCSCLYPNMKGEEILKGNFINHMLLFNSNDKKVILSKIRQAIAFCQQNQKEKIILSAESLSDTLKGPALAKELAEIPGVDLRVIVYLRRQDTWLESAWKQWNYKTRDARDIAEFVQKKDCDWYKKLQLWEESVGKERIIVRCYEKEQLPDGLIPDFLKLVGIDYPAHTWIDREDKFIGFQRDVMEILFLNKDFCTGSADNRLQIFFERNLDESFRKESFKSYSFLSPAERIAILKRYDASNQKVAREYLARDDGVVFHEPWPSENDPWEPYKGLTVEAIVPVFFFLLYNLQENFHTKVRIHQAKPAWLRKLRNTVYHRITTIRSKILH